MTKNSKKVCAHYISSYLPLTENWVHTSIKNLKLYTPIIITRKILNLDLFPNSSIKSLSKLKKTKQIVEIFLFKILGYIPYFYRACKNNNTDILHVHFGNHGIKSIGLKKKLRIPMVCSFYGADAFKITQSKKVCAQYNKMFRHVNIVLALGQYMKMKLISLGCPEERIKIHHLGIDTEAIVFKKRKLEKGQPVKFLLASSFVKKKGIDDVIKALGILKPNYPFKVDIIGDGPLSNEIKSLILINNLQEDIIFHGYRPYTYFIEKAYECDIFLQASKTTSENDKEGTPMSIVDVMATGMPVISTYHSDIPEIVINNYNGFLAEENNFADFARCIELLLKSSTFESFSRNARMHIETNFNAKIQAQKLEKIYEELIDQNQYL